MTKLVANAMHAMSNWLWWKVIIPEGTKGTMDRDLFEMINNLMYWLEHTADDLLA